MKKLLFLILFSLPLIVTGQEVNKLFRKALRTKDLNKKITLLNEIIKLDPKNHDAYFMRGLAKSDLGDFHSAIVDYSKIIIEQPDADTYYNRGNARYSIKDLHNAKEDYAKAFMLDHTFIDALYSLACVRFDLGEYEKAIIEFNKVIELAPNYPKAYTLRAASYKALNNYQNALNDYSIAILLEKSSKNYFNRGELYLEIKQLHKASNDFIKAITLNNNNVFAYFHKGITNLLLKNYMGAIEDFSTVIKFDNTDFDAHLGLALTYYKLNNYPKAKQHFNQVNSLLSLNESINNINQYNSTYWFQNQYYYLNQYISSLARLK